jgi:hypothetical protein
MKHTPNQSSTKRYQEALKKLEKAKEREAKAREALIPKGKFHKAARKEAEENLRKYFELFRNPPKFPKQPVVPLPLP